MEVAVTHRKERTVAFERPSRSNIPKDGNTARKSKSSWVEETVYDITVIYHGVAFIDLTPLLNPGGKRYNYLQFISIFESVYILQ